MGAPIPSTHAAQPGKVTLALLAAVLALAYGIWYAYSVILVALLDEFGWTRSMVAGAFSMFAVIHGCVNPLSGILCERVAPSALMAVGGLLLSGAMFLCSLIQTPWQLYLYFGLLSAVSVAACGWVPAVVQVQRRFAHRLGFAIGIVSSGVGVGMLVVVPLCQAVIGAAGWRTAFRVLGVLAVLVIVPAALYLLTVKMHWARARSPHYHPDE